MRRMRGRSWSLLLAGLLLAAIGTSCDGPFGLGDDDERDRLRANRARWERLGPASYDLTVRSVCFCGYVDPVRVEVRDGVKVAIVPTTEPGFPVPLDHPSVPELFDIIDRAIEQKAHRLDVEYGDLGVPVRIAIDYRENVVDDEITWDVLELTPR